MEALGINLPFLIAQIINFVVLMILLRMFLYRPILNMLTARRERIRESLAAAETARSEVQAANQRVEAEVAAAWREGQEIIARAREAAERQAAEIVAQAREQADAEIARRREEIAYERQQMVGQLREQVAQLSLAIAQRVIGRELTTSPTEQRALIDQFIVEAGELR